MYWRSWRMFLLLAQKALNLLALMLLAHVFL